MSAIVSFNSAGVPPLNNFISQATIAQGVVYVSGTAGTLPETGKLISDNFEDQARQAFANIKIILSELGCDMSRVVKTTIWMVSGADPAFSKINKVYQEFFSENPPARSAPQVMPFPGGILVSVECVAVMP